MNKKEILSLGISLPFLSWVYDTAFTICFAASFKLSADKILSFDSFNIFFPSWKFVPASLTTKGMSNLISLAASTTPLA